MTVIDLPLPPSTNGLFAGKTRRYRSPAYETWLEAAGWQIRAQRPEPVMGRVHLLIEVAEPKTKRATDLSNRLKATEDILVKYGIIEGDDQRYVRQITLKWNCEIEGVRATIFRENESLTKA